MLAALLKTKCIVRSSWRMKLNVESPFMWDNCTNTTELTIYKANVPIRISRRDILIYTN